MKSATGSNAKTARNSNRNPPVAPTGHFATFDNFSVWRLQHNKP
ncbi:hypothetical protein [Nitrosomonas sp.]|nr:hypothetical protein [Nitrosomonas sp.]